MRFYSPTIRTWRACRLVTITEGFYRGAFHVVKSIQLIGKSSIRKYIIQFWNELQWLDLTIWYLDSSASNERQGDMVYF